MKIGVYLISDFYINKTGIYKSQNVCGIVLEPVFFRCIERSDARTVRRKGREMLRMRS